ncbi:hypothetical protein M0P65_03425 [Candidatus Gracilibacteria bacterium]|nr:hypothetical protein [Candidatus Gracilibacteria bacterium]
MKKYRKIIIGAAIFIIFLTAFILVNNSIKQKRIIEERKREDIEVQNKLNNLKVAPLLKKEDIKVTQEETKKTEGELIQEEDVKILSFVNSSQCDELVYLKEKCRDKFLYTLSVRGGSLSYCDRLKSEQEKLDCRDEINNNSGNCSAIKNSFLKSKCEYNYKSLTESKQDQQTLNTAITSSNSDLCKTLDSGTEKENCVRSIAVKTKNLSLCTSIITTKVEQDKCIKNTSYELNRAIIIEAYQKKDLSICEKLTDSTLKTQCKSMKF